MTTEPNPPGGDAAPPSAGTPLYVHLPFCEAKCHYCDFYSVAAAGHDIDGMLAAILEEAAQRAPAAPRTVFFGGGTPSLLEIAQLRRIFDALDAVTGFRRSALEVTVECNPESLDREKARALLELGATRLSIGFQSLDDARLTLFGRVHAATDCLRAFDDARAAGASNVNVDLIYAAPGQTPEQWGAELRRVLELRPDHVSAYNLTFEPGTAFGLWLDEGRLARHGEDVELEFWTATRELLLGSGFDAYEISNYTRNRLFCRHNVNYWRNGDYVGIGPSAASRAGATRFGNLRAIAAYVNRIRAGSPATAWTETLPPARRLGETWWLGLRLAQGLSPREARARAACDLAELGWDDDPAVAVAEEMRSIGMLECHGDRYRLTERGTPLADAVAREFLSLDEPRPVASASRTRA